MELLRVPCGFTRSDGHTVKLPPDRAFLVRFDTEADPEHGPLFGRVEHLESGRRASFSSTQELGFFFREVLLVDNRNHKNGDGRTDGRKDPLDKNAELSKKGVKDNEY